MTSHGGLCPADVRPNEADALTLSASFGKLLDGMLAVDPNCLLLLGLNGEHVIYLQLSGTGAQTAIRARAVRNLGAGEKTLALGTSGGLRHPGRERADDHAQDALRTYLKRMPGIGINTPVRACVPTVGLNQ